MILTFDNVFCGVVGSSEEKSWLDNYLAYDTPGARYTRMGKVSLYNRYNGTFAAGLLPVVKRGALEAGWLVQTVDKRFRPAIEDPSVDLEWLRHHPAAKDPIKHQLEAVERGCKAGRGVFYVPTGGGKTEIFIGLTKRLPGRWLFLVPALDLVDQAADRFETRMGERAGRIGEGAWSVERVTVATFHTLARRLRKKDPAVIDLLRSVVGIGIDESHTLPANSFWQVAMATTNAFFRFGFSGTPLARGDRRSMMSIGALGPIIYRIRPIELIRAGILAMPQITMTTVVQKADYSNYRFAYDKLVVESDLRNDLIQADVLRAIKPALVFVVDVEHGRHLEWRFRQAGLRCEFIFGDHSGKERKAALKKLAALELDVVVCSVIFQAGIDVPNLGSIVNAAAGKSVIATVQKLGRGGRATTDKSTFEVWDYLDRGHSSLEEQGRLRHKAYREEGYEVMVDGTGQLSLGLL